MTGYIEIAGTAATILAVAGVILNNRRLRYCFFFWMVSNAMTAAIHLQAGIWSLVVRDILFLLLAVEGYFKWGHQRANRSNDNG